MREYTYRRNVFYQMYGHRSFLDAHDNFNYSIEEQTVVEDAILYLQDGSSYLRFPGAARAVAIATADFVSKEFGEDFFSVLNDPFLMHENDPFFKTYDEDKMTYDAVLSQVPRPAINWKSERMAITKALIEEEYLLTAEGLRIVPRENAKPS